MSISGLAVGLSPIHTNAPEAYDHAILLVDKTKVETDTEATTGGAAGSPSLSRTDSGAPLNRRWTKGTLREELARRKYSKWQEDTANGRDDNQMESSGNETAGECGAKGVKNAKPNATRTSRLRDRNPFRSKKHAIKAKENDTFIDILYENQRGAFFCGIPLYSENSLLNFDPSPWQTSTFSDSPVNITNAQVPDPSWAWAWRTWYVDMSYDVDEEGWQYSFSFSQGYAWHGTQPWFYSFVRRRRWLRKRVRVHALKPNQTSTNIRDAHLLNADYFTIHTTRDRSRGSSAERTVNNRSSILSNSRGDSELEEDSGDVSDILKFMAVLKRARVDREKTSAVKAFLDQGGDDLLYLGDKMAEIMNLLIYHTSRLQLQSNLRLALEDAKIQEQPAEDTGKKKEASARRLSNLAKAVSAADEHVNDDHDVDSSGEAKEENETMAAHPATLEPEAEIEPEPSSEVGGKGDAGENRETIILDEVKGIPDGAENSEAASPRWASAQEEQPETPSALNKGKGKAS